MTNPWKRRVEIGDAVLYEGDALEIMPTLEQVDLLLTDPPYGIGENHRKVASRGALAAPKNYGEFSWDEQPASAEAIRMARGCAKQQIIFGGNYFEGLPPSPCWLVWDKENSGDFADCELAWTNFSRAVRIFRWRWNGMIRKGNEDRYHPTQKPVALMEWCLGFAPNAETVLDCYMGSGTTGVACVNLDRKAYEADRVETKAHAHNRAKRIEEAYKQPRLFDEPPPKPVQERML
jgi:DNA modification methylase